jgi:hypothetical protein
MTASCRIPSASNSSRSIPAVYDSIFWIASRICWRYTSFVFIEKNPVRFDVGTDVRAERLLGDKFDRPTQFLRKTSLQFEPLQS